MAQCIKPPFFEEPLYDTTTDTIALSHKSPAEAAAQVDDFSAFSQRWHSSKKKMLASRSFGPQQPRRCIGGLSRRRPFGDGLDRTTSNYSIIPLFQSIDAFIAPLEKSGEDLSEYQRPFGHLGRYDRLQKNQSVFTRPFSCNALACRS